MALFFIGVIEMVISANWTKSVAKANIALTGAITSVNIFIWYYVIRVVVDDIENWFAIIPYTAGCAIGAMLGAVDWEKATKRLPGVFARRGKRPSMARKIRTPIIGKEPINEAL